MTDRTCILSGQTLPREQLIRFVAGPDGHAVADLAEKLPGRGVWVENSADCLRRVAAKGMLKRHIGAGFRDIEADIAQIDQMLHQRVLSSAGLARRAGDLVGGSGKLAAEGESFAGLLAAPDASEREMRRLCSRLDVDWTSRALSAEELGQVFGRDSLVFAAVRRGGPAKTAENLRRELVRQEAFSRSSSCQAG